MITNSYNSINLICKFYFVFILSIGNRDYVEWNYGFNGNLFKGVLVLQSFHSQNLTKLINAIDVKPWVEASAGGL
jgi:hypothetical protein